MFAAHLLRSRLLVELSGSAGHAARKLSQKLRLPMPSVLNYTTGRQAIVRGGKGFKVDAPRRAPGSQGFLIPAAFACTTSGAAFAYALAKDKEMYNNYAAQKFQALRSLLAPDPAPAWLPAPLDRWWLQLRHDWSQLSSCQRLVYGVMGVNAGVFALWQIPRLGRFMVRNFLQSLPPAQTRLWTMVTCNFSHPAILHFGVNMYGAHMFLGPTCALLGPPQAAALYFSAGMFSSLASHLGSLLGRSGATASVGASGAIYGCVAVFATFHPEAKASLIFLPFTELPLGQLVLLVIGVDALGALLRWRWLDHWGHLGGAAFGWFYARYGRELIGGDAYRPVPTLGFEPDF